MNILVVGNGVDLAHKLPTSYKDFLIFLRYAKGFYDGDFVTISRWKDSKDFKALNTKVQDFLLDKCAKNKNDNLINELISLSLNNIWLKHFKNCLRKNKFKGENWIDFESEITKVVKSLEYLKEHNDKNLELPFGNRIPATNIMMYENGKRFIDDISKKLKAKNELPNILDQENIESSRINPSDLENYFFCKSNSNKIASELNNELNNLIRCLEIYLSYVVSENIKINEKLHDIENIEEINKLISFNYTSTFKTIYDTDNSIEYDYIHGESDKNRDIKGNNMVLGIDEYLCKEDRNKKLDFIQFKKYFQRIYKKTGCKYKKWLEEMKNINEDSTDEKSSNNFLHNIYIYGHSLDITDKDIFKDLIIFPKTKITIYYYDEDDHIKKISNIVRLIGQDELIDRVYGSNPKIVFEQINK